MITLKLTFNEWWVHKHIHIDSPLIRRHIFENFVFEMGNVVLIHLKPIKKIQLRFKTIFVWVSSQIE